MRSTDCTLEGPISAIFLSSNSQLSLKLVLFSSPQLTFVLIYNKVKLKKTLGINYRRNEQ